MDEKNTTVLFMVYEEGMAPWRGGGGSGAGREWEVEANQHEAHVL